MSMIKNMSTYISAINRQAIKMGTKSEQIGQEDIQIVNKHMKLLNTVVRKIKITMRHYFIKIKFKIKKMYYNIWCGYGEILGGR